MPKWSPSLLPVELIDDIKHTLTRLATSLKSLPKWSAGEGAEAASSASLPSISISSQSSLSALLSFERYLAKESWFSEDRCSELSDVIIQGLESEPLGPSLMNAPRVYNW